MFSLRNFVKKGLLDAVGKMADYQVILNAMGWYEKNVLLEEDLAEIQAAIDEKNTPKPEPEPEPTPEPEPDVEPSDEDSEDEPIEPSEEAPSNDDAEEYPEEVPEEERMGSGDDESAE